MIPYRTHENWTYGMLNIPLIFGHNNRFGVNPYTIFKGKMNDKARCYEKPFPVLDRTQRYPLFEIDTKDTMTHFMVLAEYRLRHIDVYYHETHNGYHYFGLKLMSKSDWHTMIDDMTDRFNPDFVKYALRVIPNKWTDESELWKNGHIIDNGSHDIKRLQYLKDAIESPYIFNYNRTIPLCVQKLTNIYCISRYPFKRRLQT